MSIVPEPSEELLRQIEELGARVISTAREQDYESFKRLDDRTWWLRVRHVARIMHLPTLGALSGRSPGSRIYRALFLPAHHPECVITLQTTGDDPGTVSLRVLEPNSAQQRRSSPEADESIASWTSEVTPRRRASTWSSSPSSAAASLTFGIPTTLASVTG